MAAAAPVDLDAAERELDAFDEVLTRATHTAAEANANAHGLEDAMRLVDRALRAASAGAILNNKDAERIFFGLFSRRTEQWHGTSVGFGRTSLFELATLALGRFATQQNLESAVPYLQQFCARAVADAHREEGDDEGAPLMGGGDDMLAVREVADALHVTFRDPTFVKPLGGDDHVQNLLAVIAAINTWEFGVQRAREGALTNGRLPEAAHVRLRAELVAWLMAWMQISDLWDGTGVAAVVAAAAADPPPENADDPWMTQSIDAEQRHTRSDLYMSGTTRATMELLTPVTTAAVYHRVFNAQSSAAATVPAMLKRLEPLPAFGQLCTRCMREYDGRVWADPRELAAVAARAKAADAARATAIAAAARGTVQPEVYTATQAYDTARPPPTAARQWEVRVAPAPTTPQTTAAEIRARDAATRNAALGMATGRAPGAAAAAGQPNGGVAAIIAAEAEAALAPLPPWARAATEDAWVLQAWFIAVDRRLQRILPPAALTHHAGASECRARYFFRVGVERAPPTQSASGRMPMLPVVGYVMPRVVVVRCNVCARVRAFGSARAAVAHWVREVRGPCHGGKDEFGRELLPALDMEGVREEQAEVVDPRLRNDVESDE